MIRGEVVAAWQHPPPPPLIPSARTTSSSETFPFGPPPRRHRPVGFCCQRLTLPAARSIDLRGLLLLLLLLLLSLLSAGVDHRSAHHRQKKKKKAWLFLMTTRFVGGSYFCMGRPWAGTKPRGGTEYQPRLAPPRPHSPLCGEKRRRQSGPCWGCFWLPRRGGSLLAAVVVGRRGQGVAGIKQQANQAPYGGKGYFMAWSFGGEFLMGVGACLN